MSDRFKIDKELLIAAALLVCVFTCIFNEAVFTGKSLLPGDLIYFYEPWYSDFSAPFQNPSNMILVDEVLEFYPWREAMRTVFSSGQILLWDPTGFCGYPFMGLFQTAFLYPLDRMLDAVPAHTYPLIRNLLHILLAGIGTALYLKNQGRSRTAILLGATAFGVGGFMMVWLGHPHSKVAAWLPWLYLGIDYLMQRKKFGTGILALAATGSILAGHIETALHTGTAAAMYLLLNLFWLDRRENRYSRVLVQSVIATLLAVLIASCMILPFAEYLSQSVAYSTRADGVVVKAWLDKVLVITNLIPDLFGNSADRSYWYRGYNYAELTGGFLGSVMLSLGISGMLFLSIRKIRYIHSIIAFICFCVVYKISPVYEIFTQLPGYQMSYNFRMVLPMAFSLVILAAWQWDEFTASPEKLARCLVILPYGKDKKIQ